MPQIKKIASSTLAALLLASMPALSGAADGAAAGLSKEAKAPETLLSQPAKGTGELGGKTGEPAKPRGEQAVLKVNGKAITRSELDRSLRIMLAQNRTGQLPPPALKKAEEAVLEQLTNSELLYQAAQGEEMKELEQEVAKQLAEKRKKFPSEVEYEAALAEMQMTPREMEEFTRRDVAINHLVETRLASKGEVSDEEARKFYDDNRGKYFEKGERVRASHILVAVKENASADEKKLAREKAEGLLKRLKEGAEFSALARSESNCPSSAKGGDLGEFGKGEMVPTFEEAAFALKPGELSAVVESRFGYHLIKVAEKIPPRTDSFEEVKAKILVFLKRQKIGAELPAFLKELREKAKIEKV